MAQILVRNIPDSIKAKLVRRAQSNSRSLEAEVRSIISAAAAEASGVAGAGWVDDLAKAMKRIGVTDADIDDLNNSIEHVRNDRRTFTVEDGKVEDGK